jgi:hypothetical protein
VVQAYSGGANGDAQTAGKIIVSTNLFTTTTVPKTNEIEATEPYKELLAPLKTTDEAKAASTTALASAASAAAVATV